MDAPLAERLRPQNLDEFLGQNKILGQQSLLRKSLENDSIPSMIFWGPPGCGKTSLAHVIKQHTKKRFVALSAVASGESTLFIPEKLHSRTVGSEGNGLGHHRLPHKPLLRR